MSENQKSERPTPRTDAAWKQRDGESCLRHEFRKHESHVKIERELADAIRERDNAITDAKQWEVDSIRALHERNEARAQRDALADAIQEIKNGLENDAENWLSKKYVINSIINPIIAKLNPPQDVPPDR